ncbi:DUF427 domain-containing protein [Tunturibacter empetritectus]|uniref:DUF427 domain-containing protein n=1 Tax=Tunturiibacter empetritectus TaxID=3069691 RepID=A0AAU7ZDI4_9BACT
MDRREISEGGTEAEVTRKESVWDYPRPPRLEATARHLRVVHEGVVVAETRRGMRILETSHPPVYYFPPEDVAMQLLRASGRRGSFCEFKGVAGYWDLVVKEGASLFVGVAWSYANPSKSYSGLKDYLAFYANRVDECWVDEERVVAQPGDFYGGWISSHVTGPFKGAPGTLGW